MIIRYLLISVFCALSAGRAFAQTLYHNRGVMTNQVVAADFFLNDGYFEVQNLLVSTNINGTQFDPSLTPYDMTGTRGYTNNGTFRGLSARFDTVDDFGQRVPAETFVNTFNGTLDFADGFHFGTFVVPQFITFQAWYSPFSSIRVDAKSIVNQGLIRVGAGGLLQLGRTNELDGSFNTDFMDLKDGVLAIDPLGLAFGQPILSSFISELVRTNTYLNELGIYDVAWGVGTYTNQSVAQLMIPGTPTLVVSPQHDLLNQFGPPASRGSWIVMEDPQSWGLTFNDRGTNIVIQVVFVKTADTNYTADVRWYPGAFLGSAINLPPDIPYLSSVIKLTSVTTNALTLQQEESNLFIFDQLGTTEGFNNLITNDKYPFFQRPNNYFVMRSDSIEFLVGTESNLVVTPSLFSSLSYSNQIVTNFYSGYWFNFNSVPWSPPGVPGVNVHDLPGRVELRAKALDLTRTGIRGEGLVSMETDALLSATNTVIDAENLAFDFAYTNLNSPTMRIENLAKESVARFKGQVRLWSGTFTNQVGDAQSNVFNLLYHVTMVDASAVSAIQPVSVADFRVRTESLHVVDRMIVSNRFDVNSSDVTISGGVELRNVPWTTTNLPNVTNLVIESTGSLRLPGLADFGMVNRPLTNFVNDGTITAYSESIYADNVEVSGNILSGQEVFFLTVNLFGGIVFTNVFVPDAGPVYVNAARSGRINGGTIATGGDVNLNGPVYKLDNSTIASGAALNLNVTSALLDSGPTSGNVFSASNSVAMTGPSARGALLGTEINLEPAPRVNYRFRWAAPRGVSEITNIPTTVTWTGLTNTANSVFQTNVAVGNLRLHTGTNTIFEFRGTEQNRALYVDLLSIEGSGITNLTSLTNQIRLVADGAGSIDIYYADVVCSNLSANVSLGFSSLAEFLNGKRLGGGTLRWVPNFNGPNTSEDVVVGSESVRMNRALRHSQIIDMDGDGIANANDDLPLENRPGPVRVSAINIAQANGAVNVTFNAFQGLYQVQYTDSLEAPSWKTATSYTHRSSTAQVITVSDPNPVGAGPRFYRLVYTAPSGN